MMQESELFKSRNWLWRKLFPERYKSTEISGKSGWISSAHRRGSGRCEHGAENPAVQKGQRPSDHL